MNMYQQKVDLEEQEILLIVPKMENQVKMEQVDKLEVAELVAQMVIKLIHMNQDPEVLEQVILVALEEAEQV